MLEHGPLLFVAMLLFLAGIQFLSVGLIGEMLARTYYEYQKKPIYALREIKGRRPQSTPGMARQKAASGLDAAP